MRIMGKDRFGNVDCYARFARNEQLECYKYLNELRTGCMGSTVKFWVEEV